MQQNQKIFEQELCLYQLLQLVLLTREQYGFEFDQLTIPNVVSRPTLLAMRKLQWDTTLGVISLDGKKKRETGSCVLNRFADVWPP